MTLRFATAVSTGTCLETRWFNTSGCRRHTATSAVLHPAPDQTKADDFEDWNWPDRCDTCQDAVPETGGLRRLQEYTEYNTPSGKLEPGCLYWYSGRPEDYFWDNHRGPHLGVIAPNGFAWVIDAQAKNCAKARDRHHRCWKWIGDPYFGNVSVIRDDTTCRKGPPMLQLGDWSGTLLDGRFAAHSPAVLHATDSLIDL